MIEKIYWDEFLNKKIDVETHKTYNGQGCSISGKVSKVKNISGSIYIYIEDTYPRWVNTEKIISIQEIEDEDE